ncbi:MAG: FKBP-type peptidyl-prolyl cis-trans isomerase [Lishizhenia sp.]
MKLYWTITFPLLLFSCELEGVKKVNQEETLTQKEDTLLPKKTEKGKLKRSFKDSVENILSKVDPEMEKVLKNGIKIKWFKKGSGAPIEKFDVLAIDYRAKLTDGKVYDGNHLINKSSIAFPVGWNLQTKGWEIALLELNIGDEVEIYLPSNFARGKKGIPGLVPENADNILELRVLNKIEPTKVVDGIKAYVVEQSKNHTKIVKSKSKVAIDYFVSTTSISRYDNSYQHGKSFEIQIGDKNVMPGLSKGLLGLKEMDKVYLHIPSKEAYGKKGLRPNVKPNEDLLFDIILSKVD